MNPAETARAKNLQNTGSIFATHSRNDADTADRCADKYHRLAHLRWSMESQSQSAAYYAAARRLMGME